MTEDLAGLRAKSRRTSAIIKALLDTVRLAAPQKWLILGFLSLYFLVSFLRMIGLLAFNAGLSFLSNTGAPLINGVSLTSLRVMNFMRIPTEAGWIFLLAAFIIVNVAAVAMDHLGWILRLKLLSDYEANRISQGLEAVTGLDPRDISTISRRQLRRAVHSDCKSLRAVFQLFLLIVVSVVQTIFPFVYMFTLDIPMSLLASAGVIAGFVPAYLMNKTAWEMSFTRQDVSLEASRQVSRLLSGSLDSLKTGSIKRQQSLNSIGRAVKNHHTLWRKQYLTRSLSGKIVTSSSLMGTFAVLLLGIIRVKNDIITWPDVLTFVVALQIVLQPLSGIGVRLAKIFEHLPRGIRHLEFVRLFSPLALQQEAKQEVGIGTVDWFNAQSEGRQVKGSRETESKQTKQTRWTGAEGMEEEFGEVDDDL